MGDIAPDHARSTYLAINNLTYFGSGIIGSAFIALGAFWMSSLMSSLFLGMGLVSVLMFFVLYPLVQAKDLGGESMPQKSAASL